MIIVNETPYALTVSGKRLGPYKSGSIPEFANSNIVISYCDNSCVITTKDNKRTIKNSGELVAKEGKEEDKHNMKYIHVTLKK